MRGGDEEGSGFGVPGSVGPAPYSGNEGGNGRDRGRVSTLRRVLAVEFAAQLLTAVPAARFRARRPARLRSVRASDAVFSPASPPVFDADLVRKQADWASMPRVALYWSETARPWAKVKREMSAQ